MRVDLPRVISGVLGVLALLLTLEWVWPAGSVAGNTVSPARVAVQARAPALAARDTSAWVSAVLARPLFSVSRRPPHNVVRGIGVVAVGQARLAGIMITRNGRKAIFAPEGGGKQMVLPEGAAVNDSTIRRILPDRVTLASGAVLLPSYDKNRVSTGAPGFQPFTPGFANPGFNPVMPGGFQNPAFPNPGLQQPPGEEPGQPPPQGPLLLRNNMIPQRRE